MCPVLQSSLLSEGLRQTVEVELDRYFLVFVAVIPANRGIATDSPHALKGIPKICPLQSSLLSEGLQPQNGSFMFVALTGELQLSLLNKGLWHFGNLSSASYKLSFPVLIQSSLPL